MKHSLMASTQLMLVLMLSMLMPATATADDYSDDYRKLDYMMKIERSAIAVVDSNVVVSLHLTAMQDIPTAQSVVLAPELIDTVTKQHVDLPLIFINSRNQQIYYTRVLSHIFPESIGLRKKNGKNLEIKYLRSIKYEPWMHSAVLNVRKLSCACDNFKERGHAVFATFGNEQRNEEIKLYPLYQVPPADNKVKVRQEKGSAYLCFMVNKWDILPDYMNNTAELQKIHNSVNVVKNDSNVSITKMYIEGFASPEGNYDHNIMLSKNRTEALKQYLERTGKTYGIPLEAMGSGENWEGFINYLKKNSNVPQYEKLLNIATSNLAPDEKERQMRSDVSEGFKYCLDNVFPSLRCTNYAVEYTVRPFTLEESEQVFETRPMNLNINEIYKLADKYADNQQKYYNIIRKASLIYPDDHYINLTMSYLSILKGEPDEATDYLDKAKYCAEKVMNEGIVAYLRGDMEQAIQLINQAKEMGAPQAELQLEEFSKLNNNK